MSPEDRKAEARKAAFARRKTAFDAGNRIAGAARLAEALAPHAGRVIAGYLPIRTEIDPRPAMGRMTRVCRVAVPVIQSMGHPLKFREWLTDSFLIDGPFGAKVPQDGDWLEPEVLIVPLVAFDRQGGRLGYGGGFYDRTLEALRARRPTLAIGFAWAAQETEALPTEPTDQPLDMIVTEAETITL
ncbi:5-formyltetrahydrofolate cyclo-ligase [Anianabacter salinae]|uniref:5-formyltetrahydrofolate cyclo-ligase n=1 Tax=Anianabacter salinae TaxID=2851023 RepID=UPI00225E2A84|nr:5-formyltetrahydrofolate cyclo-ligase [Anianabacter salinae]MBV0913878.1 5-formyltetrahydrofolate cyclo-ligase [Anianabacter salinae]